MPETLTESFCERCGSRYTFESAAPKQRMRGMRVLSRGVKNFVLDDKTSFDEAMAAARMDTDRDSTNAQLDAFHKTFNFCMECRQYTCPNCWNEVEGRCLGCAPMLVDVGPAAAASPFLAPIARPSGAPSNGAAATNGHVPAESDDGFDPLARLAFLTAAAPPVAEPEVVPDPAPVLDAVAEPEIEAVVAEPVVETTVDVEAVVAEPVVETTVDVEAEAEPVVGAAPAIDAAAAAAFAASLVEPELIARREPVLEPEPAAFVVEPEVEAAPEAGSVTEAVVTAAPEPVVDAAPEPETAAEPEPEPVLDAAPDVAEAGPPPRIEIEPEPVAGRVIATDPLDPSTDRAAAAAARTSIIFAAMRPGQSLDEAIAEYDQVAPEPEAVAEPAVAGEPEPFAAEPEAIAATEPEPMAAEPEPVAATEPEPVVVAEPAAIEPEPVVAEEPVVAAEPEPVVVDEPAAFEPLPVLAFETEPLSAAAQEPVAPEPVVVPPAPALVEPPVVEAPAIAATAATADVVAQPTWSVMAPDPDQLTPTSPEWPSQQPAPGLPFLGRPAVPTGGVDALWAASSQQVGAPSPAAAGPVSGVQECVSCGLSLSATARFCRRCGSAQHH